MPLKLSIRRFISLTGLERSRLFKDRPARDEKQALKHLLRKNARGNDIIRMMIAIMMNARD